MLYFLVLLLKKYNLARLTLPLRTTTTLSILGELTGNILSTPTPEEIFLTVNVSETLPFLLATTTPSKAWILYLFPSIIL